MTTSDSLPPLEFGSNGCAIALPGAEEILLAAVKKGEQAEVPGKRDPEDPAVWRAEHTIRAEFLRHICLHPDDYDVDPRGIFICGAFIQGTFNLLNWEMNHLLAFERCRFNSPPDFTHTRTRSMRFDHCFLPGLRADGLNVAGILILADSTVEGETRLLGADITGQLACTGTTFTNEGGKAFSADRLKVGGNVFLDSVTVTGGTILSGAEIMGQLVCIGSTFTNKVGDAFMAQGLKVTGAFVWRDLKSSPVGLVDFSSAQVGVLEDDSSAWPVGGQLLLDGFVYERFGFSTTAEERLLWLGRMPDRDGNDVPVFLSQPYEQLIKVFRDAGREHEARKIAIAKQDTYTDHLRHMEAYTGHSTFWRFAGRWLLKNVAGYGYESKQATVWGIFFILIGWGIFGIAYNNGYMAPSKERIVIHDCYVGVQKNCTGWKPYDLRFNKDKKLIIPADYPEFNSFVFTLDAFVPIVDLHQENYWSPTSNAGHGDGFVRLWLWLHIILGWALTTIAINGLAAIIKKD